MIFLIAYVILCLVITLVHMLKQFENTSEWWGDLVTFLVTPPFTAIPLLIYDRREK